MPKKLHSGTEKRRFRCKRAFLPPLTEKVPIMYRCLSLKRGCPERYPPGKKTKTSRPRTKWKAGKGRKKGRKEGKRGALYGFPSGRHDVFLLRKKKSYRGFSASSIPQHHVTQRRRFLIDHASSRKGAFPQVNWRHRGRAEF